MDSEKEIKTMKLYSDVERVYNELQEMGYSKTDPLKVQDVSKVDQYHYHGTHAVMEFIKGLGVSSSHKVLDFGSGLGGPARFIAAQTNCEVFAVELQADLDQVALDLTTRCGLGENVKHVCGDLLKLDIKSGTFDFLVNWLVMVHIEDGDRKNLFDTCYRLIKPGGKIYSEEYYKLSDYDANIAKTLKEDIYTPYLPSKEEYLQQMQEAGFQDIQFEDLTDSWRGFVANRIESFRAARDRHVRVLGQDTYDGLLHFYTKVDEMFNKTIHIGGCRVIASKP